MEDEVAADVGCTCLIACVRLVEILDVVCLQDQHDDPVHARDNRVEGKRRRAVVVLVPYRMASVLVFAIWRSIEGVVCSRNHDEEPCNDGEDLVSNEVAAAELLAFGERVVVLYRHL